MVFSPDLGGKNGGVLSMRMQVILDSPFARPGSAPMWRAGRKESSGTGLPEVLMVLTERSKVSTPKKDREPINIFQVGSRASMVNTIYITRPKML